MPANFTHDVFLSHNSKDKPRVRELAVRLKQAGLRVWFDEWAIEVGDDIYLAIERGLEGARVQVLCLSPAALGSDWVALERSTVLFRDPSNKGRRFVPLLLADCTLPDTLRRFKYLDFRDETQAAFDDLVAACQREVEAPPPAQQPEPKALPRPEPAKSPLKPTGQELKPTEQELKPTEQELKSAKQERELAKRVPPEQAEPLAVFERKLIGHASWINSVAVSPNGTWAASASHDKTVKIWDLETGACRATLEGRTGDVNAVAITPDGKRILSGSSNQTVRVWDSQSGRELARLHGHWGGVPSVVALGDNARALSGGFDRTIRLWNLASGKCIRTILCGPDDADAVYACAVNPAGTFALSGHRNSSVRLWNLETGACLATLEGHSSVVNSIQITPDGRFGISGSDDKTIKVWDLKAYTCIGTLEGHRGRVHSIAFSADGTWMASAGFIDGTVRLWDWQTGACLQVLEVERSAISVALDPQGARLLAGTVRGEVHVFRLTSAGSTLTAQNTRRYVNAKVVLLGEGTVGKTSLAHRLIEDQYVVKDRTHGMNVWPLPLPLPPEGAIDREALLWDLAGQEDYRLIHRLFLDETALALLLINPQSNDPFAEAGDWLKALDTATQNHAAKREAARLLIFSQIDVGGMKVGNAKIERFVQEKGFTHWLATSAKSGENCSDEANGGQPSKLKQLIARHIPWDKLPWTAVHPPVLAELKSTLLKMRDTTDIRLLRFSELAQRLEQTLPGEQFDEADVRTAVTLLANHGLARPLKFGGLVLLQPELLNGYAGAIIRAARAHRDEIGCVLEADIYRPNFDFTGVDRVPRADEELLLRAMVQTFLDHSLCIAEETPHGRQLVFPSQYRREKDIPWQPDVFVSYTFGGEWQTIWTTLVVRLWYSHEFEHKELWRNAAEFASTGGHLLGLKIDNRQGEGEATISLFFDLTTPDEIKAIFIEYVHRHLARYGCNVTRDRRYVCVACGQRVVDQEAVRKRFADRKDFITCQGCDERVMLIDFIEQRLKTDPVAQKILAMEAAATQELDHQALEQILIGHLMAICGEANQIFRPVTMADYGVDGEVEFRDDGGMASGKKIYVQLKSGNSYLRTRKSDGREVFDVKNDRHLDYWVHQPVDVYLVIRQTDERKGEPTIRWMNITRHLKNREDPQNRQIVFDGEPLTMKTVWKLRDTFFPPKTG
ncbi:MAG: TIR domain-containing protein [Polyangiaceae bacterium]|nr:TIR domain-containing protein [Polyangiaceae bacterium]